jgi:hypothetical protein
MAGVTEPFTGSANAALTRGIPGGGLPWAISDAKGRLGADGELELEVEGLVLARRDPVPANLQGTNPIPNFVAVVSCLSTADPTVPVNVATAAVPADTDGNAAFEETVSLPSPCIAPIVFVGADLGAGPIWFASTGVDALSRHSETLRFKTMTPVVTGFTGATNPIRGINGGGVPWAIDKGQGTLRSDGHLNVQVKGLVVASSGVNPVATFKGRVSCLTTSNGLAAIVNVDTPPVMANSAGDAVINATLDLPTLCIAPIVFVSNGASGAWFASIGVTT